MGRKKRAQAGKNNRSNQHHGTSRLKKNKINPNNLQRTKRKDLGVPDLTEVQGRLGKSQNVRIDKQKRYQMIKRINTDRKKNEKKKWTSKKAAFGKKHANKTKDGSTRQWYFRELKKVINLSDIILQVLDARDPMGCRSQVIERRILAEMDAEGRPTKKMVFVLNKIDLVPIDVAQKWLSYLRREYPCVAFKASRQKQKNKLSRIRIKTANLTNDKAALSTCIGGEALIHLLKNYSRSLDIKKSITVGVIGYPNVGKSSIINSLKRSRACGVASTPGYTKVVQTIKLDNHISILDAPGVLFSNITDDPNLLLRNCLKLETIKDPIHVVNLIVQRIPHEQLIELYDLPNFNDANQFLYLIGQKRGKIGKGGVPNKDHAARCVIADWNDGSIPFYTEAPKMDTESAQVVTKLSTAFDVEKLLEDSNQKFFKELAKKMPRIENHPTEMDESDDENKGGDDRMEGVVEGGPTLDQDGKHIKLIKGDLPQKKKNAIYKINMKGDSSNKWETESTCSNMSTISMRRRKLQVGPMSMADRVKKNKKDKKKKEKLMRRIQNRPVDDQLDFSKVGLVEHDDDGDDVDISQC